MVRSSASLSETKPTSNEASSCRVATRSRSERSPAVEPPHDDPIDLAPAGGLEQLGRSGDNGLDGVIDQDALGLDRVYIQAKRYGLDNAVSEPDIRGFAGSLEGAKATKGVFVTTSYFTPQARAFAERITRRIVLMVTSVNNALAR